MRVKRTPTRTPTFRVVTPFVHSVEKELALNRALDLDAKLDVKIYDCPVLRSVDELHQTGCELQRSSGGLGVGIVPSVP